LTHTFFILVTVGLGHGVYRKLYTLIGGQSAEKFENYWVRRTGWKEKPSGHTKDLINGTCGLSSLVLRVDWCRETVHARWCNWLATSAASTAKAAAWPTAQADFGADYSQHSSVCCILLPPAHF